MPEIIKQIQPTEPVSLKDRNVPTQPGPRNAPLQTEATTTSFLRATSSESTDILEKRLEAWRTVVKDLINYFEEISDVEQSAGKGLDHSVTLLDVPFKDHQYFVNESQPGVQHLLNQVRSHTQSMANYYRTSSEAIAEQTIKELNKLRDDIKRQSKDVKSEFNSLNSKLSKTRNSTNSQFKELAKAVNENQRESVTDADNDPWLVNHGLSRQLHKDVKQENDYTRSIESSIDNLSRFEDHIVSSIKRIINNYYGWKAKDGSRADQQAKHIQELTSQIPDNVEWKKFTTDYPDVVPMGDRTVRSIDNVEKPFQETEALATKRTGPLGRKSGVGMFKSWKDYFFVLTGSGFLHAFPASDYINYKEPEFSIPLQKSIIRPYLDFDKEKDGAYCFEITDKASGGVFSSEKTYLLRSGSKADLDSWFNDISRYTEQSFIEKSSGVHASPIVGAGVGATAMGAGIAANQQHNRANQAELNASRDQAQRREMMPVTATAAAMEPSHIGADRTMGNTSHDSYNSQGRSDLGSLRTDDQVVHQREAIPVTATTAAGMAGASALRDENAALRDSRTSDNYNSLKQGDDLSGHHDSSRHMGPGGFVDPNMSRDQYQKSNSLTSSTISQASSNLGHASTTDHGPNRYAGYQNPSQPIHSGADSLAHASAADSHGPNRYDNYQNPSQSIHTRAEGISQGLQSSHIHNEERNRNAAIIGAGHPHVGSESEQPAYPDQVTITSQGQERVYIPAKGGNDNLTGLSADDLPAGPLPKH